MTVIPGKKDDGNDFVDTSRGNISGTVTEDIDNNGSGDTPLAGVQITLVDSAGSPLRTTVTDSTGFYAFLDVPDGVYFVIETNLNSTFLDVSDIDGNSPNNISVILTQGNGSTGNDFVDERPGTISGSVGNDDGQPLVAVILDLKFPNGSVFATTATDSQGKYAFLLVPPGNYTIHETNPDAFPNDVNDYDTIGDGDAYDTDTAVDSVINVTLQPGETDVGNDFTDSNKGSVSGTVTNEKGDPLSNVTIALAYPNGTISTVVTGTDGSYEFIGLSPGNYTLTETNPPNYPDDVSDYDTTPDGTSDTGFSPPDNIIAVTVIPGKKDDGNDFVDSLALTSSPSVSPSTQSLIRTAPPFPSRDTCLQVSRRDCTLCLPSRSFGKIVLTHLEPFADSITLTLCRF